MGWPRVRRSRAVAGLPAAGACTPSRHVLSTQRLLLYTPRTQLDAAAALAAGADPEAQRWLGNHADQLVSDPDTRQTLLRMRPADAARRSNSGTLAKPFEPPSGEPAFLVCVYRDDNRYAGALQLDQVSGQVGGWLAPGFRGRGLGSELFRAGALLAHTHFGMDIVRAGTEPGNTACRRALGRAGFIRDEGPPHHTLADGRTVDAIWVRHEDGGPVSRCC